MSEVIRNNIEVLHQNHHQQHASDTKISIGLVRIPNINPLVVIARLLFAIPAPGNYRIHYCVYHSQYPLAQRAFIESKLDQALNRKVPEIIWDCPEIQHALKHYPEQNQIFVVLATSVAEVGRDHDYDWAIAEPSSMRSIIQIAGRIQRHRKQTPKTENLFILAKNHKALKGREIAYEKPEFEAKNHKLSSHDLHEILEEIQFTAPNAIPSIQRPKKWKETPPFSNLVTLEQLAYRHTITHKSW